MSRRRLSRIVQRAPHAAIETSAGLAYAACQHTMLVAAHRDHGVFVERCRKGARMLNPVKTLKAYKRRIGRLGREETPVPWSENTVFLRRLWPDGTWQLPINTNAFTDSVTRVWDGKRWVDQRQTREQRIAKHFVELDGVARTIILDTHALEEEMKTTALFPHMKGRLQGLEMMTIQQTWLPSHAAMKQLRERLNLDEKPIAYIADQLRAMGKLRP